MPCDAIFLEMNVNRYYITISKTFFTTWKCKVFDIFVSEYIEPKHGSCYQEKGKYTFRHAIFSSM